MASSKNLSFLCVIYRVNIESYVGSLYRLSIATPQTQIFLTFSFSLSLSSFLPNPLTVLFIFGKSTYLFLTSFFTFPVSLFFYVFFFGLVTAPSLLIYHFPFVSFTVYLSTSSFKSLSLNSLPLSQSLSHSLSLFLFLSLSLSLFQSLSNYLSISFLSLSLSLSLSFSLSLSISLSPFFKLTKQYLISSITHTAEGQLPSRLSTKR